MEAITWEHNGMVRRASISAHISPFVRALGVEKAAELFVKRGGSQSYLPKQPRAGALCDLVGLDGMRRLGEETGLAGSAIKIPVANSFLVAFFKSQGLAIEEIARRVRQDSATVRKTLGKLGEVIGDAA